MKSDEKNLIIDSVFEPGEIQEIYNAISSPYRKYVMGLYTQQISDFKMPEHIENKIIRYVEDITGLSGFVLEYQFSRYELLDGESFKKPNLTPHYDGFPEPRFTFDYQLRSSFDWPLYVENKKFVLKDNQALTFSGTHQVHWRAEHDFVPGDFVEMIFCHLYLNDDSRKNSDEHFLEMNNKVAEFVASGYKVD